MYSQEYTIRMADTDAAGLIYFASLLRVAHTVYEAFMDEHHIGAATLLPLGIGLPISHADADFHAPLGLGDRVMIEMAVETVGRTSFITAYQFMKGDTVAANARIVHVAVDRAARKPMPLPDAVRTAMEPHLVPFTARDSG